MTRIERKKASSQIRRPWMIMMRKTITSVVCLAALVVLAGCMGRVRRPTYYTLNLPAPLDPPAGENAHSTLAIREFRAPAYLRQGSIVYKTSPEQIGFYAYHRWAVDPRAFVTNSIIDNVRASGAFAQVRSYDGSRAADYLLSGHLEKLEEIDYQGGIKVQVAMSAEMSSLTTGAVVWSNAVSEIGDVSTHDVSAVVSEMDRTMQRAIEKLVMPLSADWRAGKISGQKNPQ